MESCYQCITRICFILFLIPFVVSTFQSSNRPHPHPHPHLNNASDQEALLGFKSALTFWNPSPSLPTVTSWKPNVSFCEWTGVICSRRRQRVVALNVSSMGLQEYGLGGRVTTKGDVYSYGIMLLEMITKKKPTHNMFVEGVNLQKWVGSIFPNHVLEVVDRTLLRTSNIIEDDKELNCLSRLISVALLCTKESPEERLTMIDIVGQLQNIRESFLGVSNIPKFQSNITHLIGSTSTYHNNTGESQSSSTS